MLSDFHIHTSFSGDCEADAEQMIQRAIALGMRHVCITDHFDYDFPEEPALFLFDFDTYFLKLNALKEKYKKRTDVRIGIEVGLQPHIADVLKEKLSPYPFDFIIGSSHLVDHKDPYYPSFFEGRNESKVYERYFESIVENLNAYDDIDVYGHIDYIVRYGPNKNKYYSYGAYKGILDEILQKCLSHQVGLELNTGGLAYGLGHPNPHEDILRRYRTLGGELVTIGSDAHTPERVGFEFARAEQILLDCGFQYYTIFKERTPEFIKIQA